ncbi:MAG: branched-chain amino acid aminotransferase [Candidatus Dadabacteria bacterium]|nr:branched-chain amino acid aminotransferase [Candidatus Dadabacteria bacterium]
MSSKPYKIWFDGKLVPWNEAKVHVLTHTLHYGLGVFEGVRAYECHDGRAAAFRLTDHINRLYSSARIAQINIPFSKEEMRKAIFDLLIVNRFKEAYIRPIAFIGDGAMGVHPRNNPIRVAIAAYPWGAYLGDEAVTKGIRAKIASYTRMHVNTFMTKAKISGNYVNSVMAKLEVTSLGFDEAIMLDTEGYVSEGSGENIFIVRNGTLKTPSLTSILEGITRNSTMEIALDEGLQVVTERFTRDELYIADEAFLTGTAAEITPIREVDGRTIGDGVPGPVTSRLQERFFDVVRGKDEKFINWLDFVP